MSTDQTGARTVENGGPPQFQLTPEMRKAMEEAATDEAGRPASIRWFSSPDADYSGGALPRWLGNGELSNESSESAVRLFNMLSAQEKIELQTALFLGGFYGEDAIVSGELPRLGYADGQTLKAWSLFLGQAELASQSGVSADQLLTSSIQAYAPLTKQVASSGTTALNPDGSIRVEAIPDQFVRLPDPVSIEQKAQSSAQEALGRRLNQGELDAVTSVVRSGAINQAYQEAYAQIGAQRQEIQMKDAARNAAQQKIQQAKQGGYNPILPDMLNEYTALPYAQAVGTAFGTAAISAARADDPTTKLDYAIRGPADRVALMEAWANGNLGPGKLFASTSRGPDGSLVVRYNDGAQALPVDGIGLPAMPAERAVVQALRRDYGDQTYTWEANGQQRGAYGLSEEQYAFMAMNLGLDANDKSPQTQDLIAESIAKSYFAQLGDPMLVAYAMRFGYDAAVLFHERLLQTPTPVEGGQQWRPSDTNVFQGEGIAPKIAQYIKNAQSEGPDAVEASNSGPLVPPYGPTVPQYGQASEEEMRFLEDFNAKYATALTGGGMDRERVLATAEGLGMSTDELYAAIQTQAGIGSYTSVVGGNVHAIDDYDLAARTEQQVELNNPAEFHGYGVLTSIGKLRSMLGPGGGSRS